MADFKKNKITFFNSLEEENKAMAKAMAQLSPEQHLYNATELIMRIYKKELLKPMDTVLKFRKSSK